MARLPKGPKPEARRAERGGVLGERMFLNFLPTS